jgi:four helix bundle protein
MKKSIVDIKAFEFAVKIIRIGRELQEQKKEFIISKQLVSSGTSIGANVREGENAESKADFIHKLSISQKECSETIYWLELLKETDYISPEQFTSYNSDAVELMKLLTSILKTSKQNR